jgi:hypothetical protein
MYRYPVGAKQGVSASPGSDGICGKNEGKADKGEADESFASAAPDGVCCKNAGKADKGEADESFASPLLSS